ncbi:N-lysine methyltransferase KMT5A-A isoform X2 [Dunckerocampus dactyliophorus]|uniref:N-lysine methyltransferase KMT5A-A isoform X2 n=1 Tax=Dunckerocampus dactyliophorus TaxID=161453 RepID=UPI0024068D52|nr:N-lysine methyltransferase KMT5A-A isoform X2 [Dunckerocampus dactyliophorus]
MNGEIVCSKHCVTISSCAVSTPQVQDDNTINMVPEEGRRSPPCSQKNCIQRQGGRRANGMETKVEGQCSPCWPDECTSALQPHGAMKKHPQLPGRPPPASLHSSNPNDARWRRQARATSARIKAKTTARGKNSQNRKVTDFFPIRRSSRKSKTELKCEQKQLIDHLITNGIEEGMQMQHIEGKGRAVFAARSFRKGEYVVEYHGDLLEMTDAKKREAEYAQNPETGCYMYYFQYLCKAYCVDATKETDRLGRLINHSKNGNCQTKLHDIEGVPHLILVASRDIDEGEELLYDYGDRSKASIDAHPWLKH